MAMAADTGMGMAISGDGVAMTWIEGGAITGPELTKETAGPMTTMAQGATGITAGTITEILMEGVGTIPRVTKGSEEKIISTKVDVMGPTVVMAE